MTTPADEIAAAAATLRHLATAAADDSGSTHWEASRILPNQPESRMTRLCATPGGPLIRAIRAAREPYVHAPVGDYIAAMHPGVGAALADWLDLFANTEFDPEAIVQETDRSHACALAVARAINGRQP